MWSHAHVEHAAGAARRRRERRLGQFLRHERMSVAMALAESTHHTAPRGQRMARAGWWVRDAPHGDVPEELEPGTRYLGLDDDDSVPELGSEASDFSVSWSVSQLCTATHGGADHRHLCACADARCSCAAGGKVGGSPQDR